MEFYTVRVDPNGFGCLHNYFSSEDWDVMSQTMELIMLMGPEDPVYSDMWIKI